MPTYDGTHDKYSTICRGVTGPARAPNPGKAPIFQNRGKAVALPALPGTARLELEVILHILSATLDSFARYHYAKV